MNVCISFSFAGSLWFFLLNTPKVNSQKQCYKYNHHPDHSLQREGVAVEEAGEEDADSLASSHDKRENQRTKSGNRVKNEELPHRRTHGEQKCMVSKFHVLKEKEQGSDYSSTEYQRTDGENAREQVNAKHHLDGGDLVRSKQLRLPV